MKSFQYTVRSIHTQYAGVRFRSRHHDGNGKTGAHDAIAHAWRAAQNAVQWMAK